MDKTVCVPVEVTYTERGFAKIEFTDRYGVACSLQASSLASEAAIWFGCNDANPRKLIPGKGWQPIEMPPEYCADTRMHLTQEQVAALLPVLQNFVATGEVATAPAPAAQPSIAKAIDYPDAWDMDAYPTLESALNELAARRTAPAAQDERSAFEQWYAARHDAVDFTLRPDGNYDDWDIMLQWNAWQARAALTAPQDVQERDKVLDEVADAIDASRLDQRSMFACLVRGMKGKTAQPADKPEGKAEQQAQCTNSDSWNCKYCGKTAECAALKDGRNFAQPAQPQQLTDERIEEVVMQRPDMAQAVFHDIVPMGSFIELARALLAAGKERT